MCIAREGKTDYESLREQMNCLNELLCKQIRLIKKGKVNELDIYNKEAEELVERISRYGVLDNKLEKEKEALGEIYEQLLLLVSDSKLRTGEEIKNCRKNKNAVSVYRENI